MPAIKLPQFLKRFRLTILPVATDDVIPGAVLSPRRGYIYQGHLSELLTGQAEKFWKTELNPANIVYGTVERELSLSGKASLDQMGVKVEGGLGRAKSVKYSISAVHAQTFLNGTGHASMFSLTPRLHQLKKRNRRTWKMVNNKWVVLETYYADPEVWLTYGSHRRWKNKLAHRLNWKVKRGIAREIPDVIARGGYFRQFEFVSSHLRSFKRFLWDGIRNEDLRDDDGEYWKAAPDHAFMFPLLEMAGADRIRYIHEMLYVYNNSNPLSEHRSIPADQLLAACKMRAKTPYKRLEERPQAD